MSMNHQYKADLRAEIAGAIPGARVRFHGSGPARSVRCNAAGFVGFRSWGREYVTVHPPCPMSDAEAVALNAVLRRWDVGAGRTIAGPDHGGPGPFAE